MESGVEHARTGRTIRPQTTRQSLDARPSELAEDEYSLMGERVPPESSLGPYSFGL